MTLNRMGLLFGLLLGTFVTIMFAKPVQAGCLKSCWSRECAKVYGYSAVNEPYRVTHAEWTDDDQRTWDGEGVDCSGLVHKAWAMKNASGSTEFYWWRTEEVLPESYSAGGFYYNCAGTNACSTVCTGGNCPQSSTEIMDAFATLNVPANDNDNHVGLIYREISAGEDEILEAVDQAGYQDVRLYVHNWRLQSTFRGIRRAGWSSSCSSCDCKTVHLPLIERDGYYDRGTGDSGAGSGTDNPYPYP